MHTARRVIGVFLGTSVLFTLGTSIIWGVNTLFLMDAGLDIFQVLLVNAAFTGGQVFFEVPTGVIADTIGRKASFMIGIVALFVSTLWYVASSMFDLGIGSFIGASILIGFGFTCQTGAVEAWLVDALDHFGYERPKEQVFAWGGIGYGIAMLTGTLIGGVLGQIDLTWPYIARAAILLLTLVVTAVFMRDVGFEARPLKLSSFAEETRTIARAGVAHGWRHPVVRPLMLVSLVSGVYFLYAFYAWQRYALDLLGQELVWVSAVLVAGFSAAGIVGNLLVGPVMRAGELRRDPARVLAVLMGLATAFTAGMAVVGLLGLEPGVLPLTLASVMWLGFGLVFGLLQPIRHALLNEQIPSAQRATVLSFDSFFEDGGGLVGQPALGWLARAASIPVAYLVGSAFLAAAVPLYGRASRAVAEMQRDAESLRDAESPE